MSVFHQAHSTPKWGQTEAKTDYKKVLQYYSSVGYIKNKQNEVSQDG